MQSVERTLECPLCPPGAEVVDRRREAVMAAAEVKRERPSRPCGLLSLLASLCVELQAGSFSMDQMFGEGGPEVG